MAGPRHLISDCCWFLVLLAVSVSSVPVFSRTYKSSRNDLDGRLPRTVEPFHYNLELIPDIYTGTPPFKFEGYVEVFIRALEVTSEVVLNQRHLDIYGVSIGNDPNSPVSSPSPILLGWTPDNSTEFLKLGVANPLVIGAQYFIRVYFRGLMGTSGDGLYSDSYVDTDGSTKYIAATQMESIEARSAFPCFDEPDLKAPFNITVVSKLPSVTLSNMNEINTTDRGNGWTAHIFAKSPTMSTYQVCLAVGDFIYQEAPWQGVTSVPVRIWARPQMAGKLDFAASRAAKLQGWLEQETGIPYTLPPKMDHIAFPGKGGAMENWGLITYGEDYLCVDPETSGGPGKMSVVSVIAHELAHQWYGNWVTCDWWNDIWLNEGFATYYNYYPQEAVGWPTSQAQQGDMRRGTQQFLDIDQRNTSDPIIKVIDTVWKADSSFGGSTYPKGGAILRQLRTMLTPATFKRGLTRYLNATAYSTAVTDDLWAALTAQAAADGIRNPNGTALDVKAHMDAWMYQMGYPVLTLSRNGDGTATITSQRFLSPRGQTAGISSAYSYSWSVPITVATPATTDWDMAPSQYLKFGETSATITGVPTAAGQWVMINVRQTGFYRVDYDNGTRDDIVNQLVTDHLKIPCESRSQFLDDSFALARTLVIPETRAMDTTLYLNKELSPNPWAVALKQFRHADRIIRQTLWYPDYRSYLLDQIMPVYNQTGWIVDEEEPPLYSIFRRDIVIYACFYGSIECRDVAKTLYLDYTLNPAVNSIPSDQLPTALCVGVAEGGDSDWNLVFTQYQERRTSPIREERYAYLYALACTPDTVWLDRLLNYIVRGELIDARDQNQALTYMTQSTVGLPIVWAYLDNSWVSVPSSINKFTALRTIINTRYTTDDLNAFEAFVSKNPPQSESERQNFYQFRLIIQQNMDWFAANSQGLADWVGNHTLKSAPVTLAAPLAMTPMDPSTGGDDYGVTIY